MAAALWTMLVAVEPLVRVVGGSICPAPVEVEARLEGLLPPAPSVGAADVAMLQELGDRMRVTLRRADGATLGQRDLDRYQSCGDLAAAISLVVATWESDVHPEFVSVMPEGDRGALRPAGRSAFDAGAAIVATAAPEAAGSAGAALAVAGTLVAGWIPAGRLPGVRVAVQAGSERAFPVGDGQGHWRRVTGALGSQIRWPRSAGAATLDVHADLLVTALHMRGTGFMANHSEWSLDVGGGAGARLWLGRRSWRPWLDFSVAAWPRGHILYEDLMGERAALPRVDISVALGFGFAGAAGPATAPAR